MDRSAFLKCRFLRPVSPFLPPPHVIAPLVSLSLSLSLSLSPTFVLARPFFTHSSIHHRSYAFASPFNSSVIPARNPPSPPSPPLPPPGHPCITLAFLSLSVSPAASPIRCSRASARSRESLCCPPPASRFNVFSCVSLPRAYSSSPAPFVHLSLSLSLSLSFPSCDRATLMYSPASARCNTLAGRSCTPRARRALKLCAQLRAPRSPKRITRCTRCTAGKCIARLRRESGLQDCRMRQPAARPHSAALLSRFLPFFLLSLPSPPPLSLSRAVGANDGTK